VLATAFLGWRRQDAEICGSRKLYFVVLASGVVLILGLMVINYERFGSWLDFGVRYQNPGHYLYFRNLKMFFSPETRIWNCLFNLMSYYVSPETVEHMGLIPRSFAYCEGYPPSFFSFNPQFLLLVILVPIALYKARQSNSPLRIPFVVLTGIALYLHLVVCFFGTFVIVRYFVEFYYFTALVLLTALLMLVRPVWALPAFVLLLAVYIPGTVTAFLTVRPELRTVAPDASVSEISSAGVTPFAERSPLWPLGSLTASDLPRLPGHAVMGVGLGTPGNLVGQDLFAAYLVPKGSRTVGEHPRVTLRGVQSLDGPGIALVFFEDRLIASRQVDESRPVDISVDMPFGTVHRAPYQIMVVFLPRGSSYLPGRNSGRPSVLFREIGLDAGPG